MKTSRQIFNSFVRVSRVRLACTAVPFNMTTLPRHCLRKFTWSLPHLFQILIFTSPDVHLLILRKQRKLFPNWHYFSFTCLEFRRENIYFLPTHSKWRRKVKISWWRELCCNVRRYVLDMSKSHPEELCSWSLSYGLFRPKR